MLKKLIIILSVIFLVVILFLGVLVFWDSSSKSKNTLTMDEIIEQSAKIWDYVDENTDRPVLEREYYIIMRLAGDADTAIKIYNHPGYPDIISNTTDYNILENIIGEGTICFLHKNELNCVDGEYEYVMYFLKDFRQWIF